MLARPGGEELAGRIPDFVGKVEPRAVVGGGGGGDLAKAEQAAEELKLTADDALALGVVESVIPEAGLGELEFYDALSQRLMREIDALTEMPIQELLSARYARFRRFGGEAQA